MYVLANEHILLINMYLFSIIVVNGIQIFRMLLRTVILITYVKVKVIGAGSPIQHIHHLLAYRHHD